MPEDAAQLVENGRRALLGLAPSMPRRERLEEEFAAARSACERGYFTPDEDECVRGAFGRYLGFRAALLETINEIEPAFLRERATAPDAALRLFTVGFAAACMLMRSANFLVENYGKLEMVWRKLDEAEPRYGIPRKQFSLIYSSATDPYNSFRFDRAQKFADGHIEEIRSLADDATFAPIVELLDEQLPHATRHNKRTLAKNRLRYWWHSLRRRQASTMEGVMFAIFEISGRTISEVHNPFHEKTVTPDVIGKVLEVLRPGDVIVTRHDDAMTNLFLPGYWPHGALYIGSAEERAALGVTMDDHRSRRSGDPVRVLESRKDGVLFREIEDTLRVDAFVVIRPQLAPAEIAEALTRAATHEGKLYDFEFDFRRSDRLVCTEVVYRSYHSVGGLTFDLRERAGRLALAAEDLLDHAVDGNGFEPVAIFGAKGCDFLTGDAARERLIKSYRA